MSEPAALSAYKFPTDMPTKELMKMLLKEQDISSFIQTNNRQLSIVSLKTYLNWLCVNKNTIPTRVFDKADLDHPYGHHLFNGTRQNPSRDKIIQLAFGFGLDVEETQYFLKIARKSELYCKLVRDSVLIYALNNRLSIDDVNTTLTSLGMPILERCDQ